MLRTMTLPPGQNPHDLVARLVRTENREPIFGKPARVWLCKSIDGSLQPDGSWELDIHLTDGEVRGFIVLDDETLAWSNIPLFYAEDWSAIEPSLPLAK